MNASEEYAAILEDLKLKIKSKFYGEGTGHDWFHIERVYKNAIDLAKLEGADVFICGVAALLHDIDDWKFSGSLESNLLTASQWLDEYRLSQEIKKQILTIVDEVTFKGAGVETPVSSLESACVQDADRLDAIGAIGIARAFAYGGHKSRLLFDPNETYTLHTSFEAYSKNSGSTIAHFYEKLLLLKDRMQTNSGKSLAIERHEFMTQFLDQFMREWRV